MKSSLILVNIWADSDQRVQDFCVVTSSSIDMFSSPDTARSKDKRKLDNMCLITKDGLGQVRGPNLKFMLSKLAFNSCDGDDDDGGDGDDGDDDGDDDDDDGGDDDGGDDDQTSLKVLSLPNFQVLHSMEVPSHAQLFHGDITEVTAVVTLPGCHGCPNWLVKIIIVSLFFLGFNVLPGCRALIWVSMHVIPY